jgi:hypothetical protein
VAGSTAVSPVTIVGNGNAVVPCPFWNANKGAIVWVNKAGFASGPLSSSNSIVGTQCERFERLQH